MSWLPFLKSAVRVAATVALTFLGLLLVTFLIGRVVPIDPVLAAVGDRAPAEVYERVRLELGLDKPMWLQFWLYIAKVVQGDFGNSVLTSNLVIDDIKRVFPATLELATVATLMGVALGMVLEFILKESRAEIRAALAGVPMARERAARLRPFAAQARRHAAA